MDNTWRPAASPASRPSLAMEAFTAQCADPRSHQLAVLARLLSLHRDVDLLRRHGVRVPDSLSAPVGTADGSAADAGADAGSAAAAAERGEAALCLLRRLPLTSYAAYAPLIEEAVEAGRAFAPDDPAAQVRHARDADPCGAHGRACSGGRCSRGRACALPALAHPPPAHLQ